MPLHKPIDIDEHLSKKALGLFAKSQGITILGKPVDEILGQVGTPNHSQLTEEGQSSAVQPDRYARPSPGGSLTGGVDFFRFLFQLTCLGQDLSSFCFGKILQNGHVAEQPFIGRIKIPAVRLLASRGQTHQLIQCSQEIGIDGRSGQGALLLALRTHDVLSNGNPPAQTTHIRPRRYPPVM